MEVSLMPRPREEQPPRLNTNRAEDARGLNARLTVTYYTALPRADLV